MLPAQSAPTHCFRPQGTAGPNLHQSVLSVAGGLRSSDLLTSLWAPVLEGNPVPGCWIVAAATEGKAWPAQGHPATPADLAIGKVPGAGGGLGPCPGSPGSWLLLAEGSGEGLVLVLTPFAPSCSGAMSIALDSESGSRQRNPLAQHEGPALQPAVGMTGLTALSLHCLP